MLRYSESPLGPNPVRIDYADYRAVDGVQVPYRWTVARPGGQFTIQVTGETERSDCPRKVRAPAGPGAGKHKYRAMRRCNLFRNRLHGFVAGIEVNRSISI